MNVPAKLGLYGVGLVVAFAGALGAGTLTGPVLSGGPAAGAEGGGSGEGGHGGTGEPAAGEGPEAAAAPPGLQVSDGGYPLAPVAAPEKAGQEGEPSCRITGPAGG